MDIRINVFRPYSASDEVASGIKQAATRLITEAQALTKLCEHLGVNRGDLDVLYRPIDIIPYCATDPCDESQSTVPAYEIFARVGNGPAMRYLVSARNGQVLVEERAVRVPEAPTVRE